MEKKENNGTLMIYAISLIFLVLIFLKHQKIVSEVYVDAAYAALFIILILAYFKTRSNTKWRTKYLDFFFIVGAASIIMAMTFKDLPGVIFGKTLKYSVLLILSRTSLSFMFLAIIGFVMYGVLLVKIFFSNRI
jgi:hypothetical protein